MKTTKKAQVIMLPHNNINTKITLYKTASGKPLNLSTNTDILSYHTNQYLYILTDDEIKEGDWVLSKLNEIVLLKSNYTNFNYKKIIATTDTSLKIKTMSLHGKAILEISLPQLSQQFIEQYIESYNKGEIITNILVEYEKINIGSIINVSKRNHIDVVKVNPKDNTINIKPV